MEPLFEPLFQPNDRERALDRVGQRFGPGARCRAADLDDEALEELLFRIQCGE